MPARLWKVWAANCGMWNMSGRERIGSSGFIEKSEIAQVRLRVEF